MSIRTFKYVIRDTEGNPETHTCEAASHDAAYATILHRHGKAPAQVLYLAGENDGPDYHQAQVPQDAI